MQLVINTYGASLRRKDEVFRIVSGERRIDLSPRKIQSILVLTGCHFSSDVVELALRHHIDILLLDRAGQPFGRFWQTRMGSTAAIRRRQIEVATTAEGLEVVKGWFGAKLDHQADFLAALQRRRPETKLDFDGAIASIRERAAHVRALAGQVPAIRDRLMGLEGAASAVYFSLLGKLPTKAFRFSARSQRPARDPVNACLNYAYGVLYGHVERACVIAGLDPHVGLVHTDGYNKPSLVFDLIEPFRVIADRTVLKLFTGRRFKQADFETTQNGVLLRPDARALLVQTLNERLDQRVDTPIKSAAKKRTRRIRRRDAIQAEAHTFANRLLGKDGGLPAVLTSEELFAAPDLDPGTPDHDSEPEH